MLQLSQGDVLESYRTQRLAKDGTVVDVSIISTALVNEAGQVYATATTERGKESTLGDQIGDFENDKPG